MSSNNSTYQSNFGRTRQNRLRSHTPSENVKKNNSQQSKSLAKPPNQIININIPIFNNNPSFNQKYYYLGRGNNHQLIRRILQNRKNWVQSNLPSNNGPQCIHLKWIPNSYNFKFHTLGKEVLCLNHFEYHKQISNKQKLHQNMLNFCQSNKMNVYNYLPVTFVIDLNTGEEDLALHSFLKFYNRNTPDKYQGPKVNSVILPRNKFRFQPYLSPQQLNKRTHGNFYCKPHCTKMMFSKIAQIQQKQQQGQRQNIKSKISNEEVSYLWILKPTFLNRGRGVVVFNDLVEFQKLIWKYYEGEGLEDYEEKVFEQKIVEKKLQCLQQKNETQKYIKCVVGQQQGKNQEFLVETKTQTVIQNKKINQIDKEKINQLQKEAKNIAKLNDKSKNQTTTNFLKIVQQEKTKSNHLISQLAHNVQSKPRCLSFIIQKYIQRPMLVNNYKFDIRIWALLTQDLQVYFFKEGYLRLSSKEYSTSSNSHDDPFVHLTNNSVQKYSSSYDNQSGNQYPLHQLLKHLPNQTYYVKILQKIKQIVWLTFCSVRRKININSRKECFQLFGYDFMIDESFKVWLIQVNTNPAIQEASPLLKVLLPRMVDDMFKLTIDKIFPRVIPNSNNNQNKKGGNLEAVEEEVEQYSVPGYQNHENIFQLLGDLREGSNQKNYGKRLTFVRR